MASSKGRVKKKASTSLGTAAGKKVAAKKSTAKKAPSKRRATPAVTLKKATRAAPAARPVKVTRASAKAFGATDTLNPAGIDVVKTLKKMTKGGADFAFEAVGVPALLEQAFYCLAPRGTAVLVGAIPMGEKVAVNPAHFFQEKRIIGCMMGSNRFSLDAPRYLEFYRQGRLDLDGMVSRHARLEEVNDAFRAMEAGEVTRTVLMFE